MVRTFVHQPSMQQSRSFHFKRMFELPGRQTHSLVLDKSHNGQGHGHNQGYGSNDHSIEPDRIGWSLKESKGPVLCLDIAASRATGSQYQPISDFDLMKEKFAKLLLGEDMSGGGKGVSSALALSNAITNLAASIFGEQKLEPMSPEKKIRWRKEIEWFLSVTDHIVEFVPSQQKTKDGTDMEIMVTLQRKDLLMNIPALRKLDAMLLGYLDQFGNQNEFWYVSRDDDSAKDDTQRNGDKWWLPAVKVPPNGLSDIAKKFLLYLKDAVNQVLKAAMAINAQVLSEMEVPESYIESLPKNGKTCLGETIYKSITVEHFIPEQFLRSMDLSTEHKILDLENRVEASIVIWKRKMHHKDGKSSWGSGISLEKREIFEERVQTILLLLKQYFPGISQSTLDVSKIQHNKDIGQAILESYSRVIESLAFSIISRIEDVLYANTMITQESSSMDSENLSCSDESASSKTLSDFMGWKAEKGDFFIKSLEMNENYHKDQESNKLISKPSNISVIAKRFSYLEKLESLSALRSPTARH